VKTVLLPGKIHGKQLLECLKVLFENPYKTS